MDIEDMEVLYPAGIVYGGVRYEKGSTFPCHKQYVRLFEAIGRAKPIKAKKKATYKTKVMTPEVEAVVEPVVVEPVTDPVAKPEE